MLLFVGLSVFLFIEGPHYRLRKKRIIVIFRHLMHL